MNAPNRLTLAGLTSGIGAGGIGAGLALLLPVGVQVYALPVLLLGVIMHGWGMFDSHRLETTGGGQRPRWGVVLYWACWIALAGLSIAVTITYVVP